MLMTEMVCVCYSGFVQKPAVRSSVPSSIADTANSSNAESRTESTPITHNVTCITDTAAILADTQASLDLQSTSTSSNSPNIASSVAESDCQLSQPAEETPLEDPCDLLSSYEMYASPAPNDCLSDIWLSSAVVDLGSPLMPHTSASQTVMQCDT